MSQLLSQSLSQSSTSSAVMTTLPSGLTLSSTTTSNTTSSLSSQLSQNILTQSLTQTLGQTVKRNQNSSQSMNSCGHIVDSQQLSSSAVNTSNNLSQTALKNPVVILDKNRLQELVQEVDPNEQLEEEVEDMLLLIGDDFIESLVSTSAMFAKHRKSTTLDVKDVQLSLDRNWKIWIPGFGSDDQQRHQRKTFSTEAHKQRMALIKKTLKKI